MAKRKKSEAEFDLIQIRKLKRLTKRVYAGLQQMEAHIVKMTRAQAKVSRAEADAATQMYKACSDLRAARGDES